jgi:hypothetical protein
MDWSVIQQLIRIALYNAGALFLGKSVADGDLYQAAIGGVVSIVAFGWWLYQERKGKGVPPIAPVLAFVIIAPLLLGGCTSIQDGLAKAMAFMGQVRSTLVEVREGIRVGCNAIGLAEQEAATVNATCQTKVSKLRAGVEAICRNQSLLTDDVVGNYFSTVANAVKQAQASCK